MEQITKQLIADSLRDFHIPRYREIPDMGLYLEQTAKYIGEYLNPISDNPTTPSMVSNYVKKGLIDNPVKKLYSRDQIAYLIFIVIAKNVMSLDGLIHFIALQKRTYSLQKAYDYFCDQFENILFFTTELQDSMDVLGEDHADEKRLLFSCIVAVTQKIYLEKCLAVISQEESAVND